MRLQAARFSPVVSKPELEKQVLNFLQEELWEYLHDGKIYTASLVIRTGPTDGFPLEDVLTNLLKRAITDGPSSAAKAFESCTENTSAVYQHFSLLTGIHIKEPMQVFDGIWLLPLHAPTLGLPAYFPTFAGTPSGVEFMHRSILSIDYSVMPIFHRPDPEDINGNRRPSAYFTSTINSDEGRTFNRHIFCQALSLTCNSAVQIAMSWNHLGDDEIFNLGLGIGMGYRFSSRASAQTNAPAPSDIDMNETKRIYAELIGLSQNTQDSLQIPINRWIKSKAEGTAVDRMIDLGIAFESLYLAGRNDEIAFTFRLRASWYLGKDADDRKELMRKFNQIYQNRSKAVHTGILGHNLKFGQVSIRTKKFIEGAQDLCLQSILKVIQDGKIREDKDWNSVVLGGL
ncbi:MAG: hypothetical protein F4X54_09240 [Chloroflexi bacterium]|nr:hypothetical protein [Chloroflexota bacterium]